MNEPQYKIGDHFKRIDFCDNIRYTINKIRIHKKESKIIMNQNVVKWLMVGERGASSEAIVSVMENVFILPFRGIHPHDPSDFNRCVKLLNAVPEYRTRLDEMRTVSPQWDALVEHWAELEEMLAESAPGLYDRMKELGC